MSLIQVRGKKYKRAKEYQKKILEEEKLAEDMKLMKMAKAAAKRQRYEAGKDETANKTLKKRRINDGGFAAVSMDTTTDKSTPQKMATSARLKGKKKLYGKKGKSGVTAPVIMDASA